MKSEIRTIGIDDAPFDKHLSKEVLVVGTIFRGGLIMDGLVSCRVEKDGFDATPKLIELINKCKFKPQLQCIFLDGIAVAGFNIINASKLSKETGLPVIIIIRDYPDYKKMYSALKKLGMAEKIALIDKLKKPVRYNKIYIQHEGTSLEKAKKFLETTCTRSFVPEPIRIAHIIGQGVMLGESKGRA
jgi:hypothetical protein